MPGYNVEYKKKYNTEYNMEYERGYNMEHKREYKRKHHQHVTLDSTPQHNNAQQCTVSHYSSLHFTHFSLIVPLIIKQKMCLQEIV